MIAATGARDQSLTEELEDLYRRHSRLVYRTAYSITGRWEDAEDVLQTIFLRLVQRESPVHFRTKPDAYLYRAAVNISLSIVRSRKRENLTGDVELLEMGGPALAAPTDSDDRSLLLIHALAQLQPRTLEIIILHYEHDFSDAQIARMLGRSRSTIAVTLFRARRRLKKLMLRARSSGGQK